MADVDWNALLQQKYAILQQQADAATRTANASANLDQARANVVPGESAANIAQTRANTDLIGQQAKYFGPTALANIDLTRANVGLAKANTAESTARVGYTNQQTTGLSLLNRLYDLPDPGSSLGGSGMPAYGPARLFRLGG
jgi:hypothetical protein